MNTARKMLNMLDGQLFAIQNRTIEINNQIVALTEERERLKQDNDEARTLRELITETTGETADEDQTPEPQCGVEVVEDDEAPDEPNGHTDQELLTNLKYKVVLDVLQAEHKPMTSGDINHRLGNDQTKQTNDRISSRLRRLEQAGHVKRTGETQVGRGRKRILWSPVNPN